MVIKITFLAIVMLLQVQLFGQGIDSLGLGDNNYLNRQELTHLIPFKKDSRKISYDLTNKKVAFIGGTTGNLILTKKDYFDNYVKPEMIKNPCYHPYVIELTNEEKIMSGGYEVLIMAPIKIFKNKEKILTELNKTSR